MSEQQWTVNNQYRTKCHPQKRTSVYTYNKHTCVSTKAFVHIWYEFVNGEKKKTWSRMLEKATWHFPHHHLKGNYAFKTVYCRINCFSLGLNWNNFLVSEIGSISRIIMHITCKRKKYVSHWANFSITWAEKGLWMCHHLWNQQRINEINKFSKAKITFKVSCYCSIVTNKYIYELRKVPQTPIVRHTTVT